MIDIEACARSLEGNNLKNYRFLLISQLILACGSGEKKVPNGTDAAPPISPEKTDEVSNDESTSELGSQYKTKEALDCFASGFVLESKGIELVCSTTERKFQGLCTADNLSKIIPEDLPKSPKIQKLLATGYEPVQCEDRGHGIKITLIDRANPGHTTRRSEEIEHDQVNFQGTWKSACEDRETVTLEFTSDFLTRTYFHFSADNCPGDSIAEVKSSGKFVAGKTKVALIDYQPISYQVTAKSQAGITWLKKVLPEGCIVGIQENIAFEIKREQQVDGKNCVSDEFLTGYVVEESDFFGFSFPNFQGVIGTSSDKRNAYTTLKVFKIWN